MKIYFVKSILRKKNEFYFYVDIFVDYWETMVSAAMASTMTTARGRAQTS